MGRSRSSYRLIVRVSPLGKLGKKLARLPGLERILGPRLWNEYNLDATYVPVGEPVEVPEESVLPRQILEDLVSRASHRFVLSECYCRTSFGCENHPRDLGCIFLGDAVTEINREFGAEVTTGEALRHVERALASGLVPCVIHSSWDAYMLGIQSYARMLAVCFCCDCCCVFRTDMRKGPAAYRDRISRLPGLVVEAGGDCRGCGECVEACFLGAVTLLQEGPVFADFCKGCGRCVSSCPEENIRLSFEPGVETLKVLMDRIGSRTCIE